MNKKLKLLLAMLTVTTALGVASACGDNSSSSSSDPTSTNSSSSSAKKEKYTVRFTNEDNSIISEQTIEEGSMPEIPADPTFTGEHYTYVFTGWDKEVTAVSEDVIYKATYTKTAHEYTVTFMDGETQVGEVLKYTMDNPTVTEPAVPVKTDYDGEWEAYDLDGGHKVVQAKYTPTEYTVTFVHPRTGMPVLAPMTYTMQAKDEFVFPDIPDELKQPGYNVAWDKTKEDLVSGGLVVTFTMTARPFIITLDSKGMPLTNSTIEVEYNDEYVIPSPLTTTCTFLGWYDEDGNKWENTSGIWTFETDLTLTAKYDKNITFDGMEAVPSGVFSGSRVQSISLVDMNGGKALEVKSGDTETTDVALMVQREWLADFFADKDVAYLAFDVKSGGTTTGSKVYYQNPAANGYTQYENAQYDTIDINAFKTYYLPRAIYEGWVTNDIATPRLIMVSEGLVKEGESYYLDNIRPVTTAEYEADWYSFETGSLRTNNGNQPLFMLPSKGSWQVGLSNVDSATIKFTNEIVSDGNRAIQFTKLTGKTSILLNHTADTEMENAMREAGYISYDLYVPEGSNASAVQDNSSGVYATLKTGWNTIYAKVDATDNTVCAFWDDTCSTYVIDNIRLLTAEEYNTEMLSFEGKAGVLRDSTSDSKSTVYIYTPRDMLASRWTFVAQGDGATLSNQHYDTEIVQDGEKSFAFHKTNGYMSFSLNTGGEMYALLKNGFTFWIYADLDEQPAINGTGTSNFVSGDGTTKFNGGEGINIAKGEWTQITVTASEINSNGRFLIIQGSTAGTYYFDGFEPLPADAD